MPAVLSPVLEVRTRQSSSGGCEEHDSALEALWQSTRPAAHSHSLTSPASFATRTASSSSSSSSSSASASASASPSARCQRALESGHVFVRHVLSGRGVSSERVVVFVLSGVLYACRHTRHQSRYKQPFLSLPLCAASEPQPVRVYMGKQTAALRLVPAQLAPERRCFALQLHDTLLELEAPGSGDVRYWLRSLYELLTKAHALTIARSLIFVPVHSASPECVERAESRMRQLRLEGQRARRREEADRRMDGQQRAAEGKAREDGDRAAEVEGRRQRWVDVQQETESRVIHTRAASAASAACVAPSLCESRVLLDAGARLDGDRRMEEASRRDAEAEMERRRRLAVQPRQHVPALASEYAKHNQRSAALQTHTTAPLLTHADTATRRLGESKSFPCLLSALSSTASSPVSACSTSVVAAPCSATRSLSSPALRSPSLSQRRLPCHLPLSHSPSGSASEANSLPDSPRSSRLSAGLPPTGACAPQLTGALSGPQLWNSSLSSHSPSAASAFTDAVLAPTATGALQPSSGRTGMSMQRLSANPPHKLCQASPSISPTASSLSPASSSAPGSSCGAYLSSFDSASPCLSPAYVSAASLYSPTHCLPVTAVYSLHTPPGPLDYQRAVDPAAAQAWPSVDKMPLLRCSSDGGSSAAAVPSPLPSTCASVPALHSAPAPASIRFHCAIELPTHSNVAASSCCLPPPSTSPTRAQHSHGTHFHFHLHTASSSSSSSAPVSSLSSALAASSVGEDSGWQHSLLPAASPPPPPYTASRAAVEW